MKVRFKVAWQNYSVGAVIDPPAMLRDWLTHNGYVEPVTEERESEQEIETADFTTGETAVVAPQPVKRKRGRPRKCPLKVPT